MWFPDSDLQLPDDLESDDGREKRIALGSLLRRHSVMHVLLHDLQGGILSERECLENLRSCWQKAPTMPDACCKAFWR
ncbi:hypothetical protein FTV94_22425 [Escherichia coli]|nr:hypothetical protein FTV94_22425 [Escherichia coli]